jgi:hypothetical protein
MNLCLEHDKTCLQHLMHHMFEFHELFPMNVENGYFVQFGNITCFAR